MTTRARVNINDWTMELVEQLRIERSSPDMTVSEAIEWIMNDYRYGAEVDPSAPGHGRWSPVMRVVVLTAHKKLKEKQHA